MNRPIAGWVMTSAVIASSLLTGCGKKDAAPASTTATTEQPPAPGPSREAVIPAPLEKTLANGLRVIVLPRAGAALVAAEVLVLSGGEVDPADRAGLADFTASLLTQGTKSKTGSRSAPQLAQAAEALGGSLRAQAGWDASRVGITVTTPKLAAALDLLADVIRNPAFANNEIERYRAQTLDGLRVSLSDPGDLAPLIAARAVYGAAPYGHARSGTLASVQRITAADLRALHASYYRPDNTVLILSGGLDPDTGFALAGQVLGDWTAAQTPITKPSSASSDTTSAKLPQNVVIDLPEAGQATVIAALPLPSRKAEDYYSGLVTSNVLGGGYSARLNSEIRIKRGLSYGAGARLEALRDGGALYASAQTKNESAAEVAGLIRAELARLSTETVSATELTARKASFIGSYARTLETASGIAGLIATRVAQDLPADEVTRVIGAVNAVTAEQVQAYASAHLKPADVRLIVVGDAKQFSAALRKDGSELLEMPAAEVDLDRVDLRKPLAKP